MPYLIIMFAAGLGIPVLAALNGALGRHLGSPALAAMILFVVAFGVASIVTAVTGPHSIHHVLTAPRHLFLAGTLVAFYVLTITWIAPIIGVGNAVFMVLLGQIVAAAAIDHFGLMGAVQTSVTATRLAGIAVMTFGLYLVQRG